MTEEQQLYPLTVPLTAHMLSFEEPWSYGDNYQLVCQHWREAQAFCLDNYWARVYNIRLEQVEPSLSRWRFEYFDLPPWAFYHLLEQRNIIAPAVDADVRTVTLWTQPIVKKGRFPWDRIVRGCAGVVASWQSMSWLDHKVSPRPECTEEHIDMFLKTTAPSTTQEVL